MAGINGFGQTGANWTKMYEDLKGKKANQKTAIERYQEKALKAADLNKDGQIDDIEAALLNNSENAEKIFTSKDKTEVTQALMAYNRNLNTTAKQNRAKNIVDNMAKGWEDKNGDGKIDVDELSDNNEFFKPLKNIFENSNENFSIEELINYFDLLDKDKNGSISDTEQNNFSKLVMNNYDKKGSYTKDEVISALQKAISNNETEKTTSLENNIINAVKNGSIYNLKETSLPNKTQTPKATASSSDASSEGKELPSNIHLPQGATWEYQNGTYVVTEAQKNGCSIVTTYNSNGTKTSENKYDSEGDILIESTYNTDGNILTQKEYSKSASGGNLSSDKPILTHSLECTYDNQGRILSEKIYNHTNPLEAPNTREINYRYDNNGNLLFKTISDIGDLPVNVQYLGYGVSTFSGTTRVNVTTYITFENGKAKEAVVTLNGQKSAVYNYTDGKLTSAKTFKEDGKIASTITYNYSGSQSIPTVTETSYEYNKKGKVISTSTKTRSLNTAELEYLQPNAFPNGGNPDATTLRDTRSPRNLKADMRTRLYGN